MEEISFKKDFGKMISKVKFYNEMKAYGFIEGDEDGDIFFHATDLTSFDELQKGDSVEFEVVKTKKGKQAKKIKKL